MIWFPTDARPAALVESGHDRRRILVDPRLGYAKTLAHTVALLRTGVVGVTCQAVAITESLDE